MTRFQCYRMDSGGIRWRLLGGNNRVLGLSVRGFPDHPTTIREVEAIRAQISAARTELERGGGLWWWRMALGDVPIARSAQGFARKIDASLAARRFRDRVGAAALDLPLMVFQSGHRGREARPHS